MDWMITSSTLTMLISVIKAVIHIVSLCYANINFEFKTSAVYNLLYKMSTVTKLCLLLMGYGEWSNR